MTKKDFFRVIIKLFGLYLLISSIYYFFYQIITTYSIINIENDEIYWIVGAFLLILVFFISLLFFTDMYIDLFKLDKGFDDQQIILGDFDLEKLVQFSLLLTGLIMITNNLPQLINETLLAFKHRVSHNNIEIKEYYRQVSNFRWVSSGLYIIIGYILINNFASIGKFFIKKKKN
jgi:hypothetical protein